jgi:hypothetical protein
MMKQIHDKYELYVEHPRYGQGPRMTGLNPKTDYGGDVFLHWHSSKEIRIPNTAIPADLTRQTRATVPVTHYYDVKRECLDCGKPFLFFAEEQKHWYEELGFGLDSDCVRCVFCRKRQHGLARKRERYEELFHIEYRTTEESLEMVECCLSLIEANVFHYRQTERVRMLLKIISSKHDEKFQNRIDKLRTRLLEIEMNDFERFVKPKESEESETELIREASECLDRFTERFNACDTSGMDTELHFPHVIFSGSERLDWPDAGQHPSDFFKKLRASGWYYTQYESKEPVLVSREKVHFVVRYSRRKKNGDVLSMHANLWIVTRVSGKWGISLRSY